jgi:predicted nucleotidyltransferase
MTLEQQIEEFVRRLHQSAGDNLEAVILYGSAANQDFVPELSDINLLCLLKDASFVHLAALHSPTEWWRRQKHVAPLVMTRDELPRSADVFAIEFIDMKRTHRVLYGTDPFPELIIPMHLHRAQVEYELREKTILLRQKLLIAGDNKRHLWELLLDSVSAFGTLFRHTLIAFGDNPPATKREAVERLSQKFGFDPSAFLEVLEVRHSQLDRAKLDVQDVFRRYLVAVEHVTNRVDAMLDGSQPKS